MPDINKIMNTKINKICKSHKKNWINIIKDIYNRSLKWAYHDYWNDPNNILNHVPYIR